MSHDNYEIKPVAAWPSDTFWKKEPSGTFWKKERIDEMIEEYKKTMDKEILVDIFSQTMELIGCLETGSAAIKKTGGNKNGI